jgi:hypothetical protein
VSALGQCLRDLARSRCWEHAERPENRRPWFTRFVWQANLHPWIGGDEFCRWTLVVPLVVTSLVVPLWSCRNPACEACVQDCSTCPPCEAPEGHQYDDDRFSLLYGLTDWSRIGDPCIWCDHAKCEGCPPPRGGTFAEEHAAGRERCWNDCATCKPTEQRTVTK